MNESPNPNGPNSETTSGKHPIGFRVLPAKRGQEWLKSAFRLVNQSNGAWIGSMAFLSFLMIAPIIQLVASILLPIFVAGLMLGCQQVSNGHRFKFDHLFAGFSLKSRELFNLCFIYAVLSIVIFLLTSFIVDIINMDFRTLLPQNLETMSIQEQLNYFETIDKVLLVEYFMLFLLIWLALLIPVALAYWFAPSLVIFRAASASSALKLSFKSSQANFLPFLVFSVMAVAYFFLGFWLVSIVTLFIPLLGLPLFFLLIFYFLAITFASIHTSYVDIFGIVDQNEKSLDNDSPTSPTGGGSLIA